MPYLRPSGGKYKSYFDAKDRQARQNAYLRDGIHGALPPPTPRRGGYYKKQFYFHHGELKTKFRWVWHEFTQAEKNRIARNRALARQRQIASGLRKMSLG